MSDADREEACEPASVPGHMSGDLAGYRWMRDSVGQSGGSVFRLHGKPNGPDAFVKHGEGGLADDLSDEMVRLRWLAGYISVPALISFTRTSSEAWLVTTALRGKTAYQVLEADPATRLAIVDALAAFLRRLHAIPVCVCPFKSDHAYSLARARERLDAGLVDVDDFDAERKGWTAEQVWEEMHRLLPLAPDAVVTHGDFSLDNLVIFEGEVTGCIDVGKAGVADRYQDLAIMWNCLGEFDRSLQERFLQQYGVVDVDWRRLQFHLMLDEFF
ncbi:APH(3')-I family aminoglycoside O-phosphotransferase [Afifella sp. JA880]|uniref:APH(3')-I family aminoglycoside O-phosphotransferase n=1 Tax=Afifella sp. JA880 TaxID=2975280 RepID=UPI0021BB7BB9|nr:APH(3')-I family aminoglycoside O-phosphotransferase [Afifella sp. JA880]MCT8268303.1 APH(3')-I family aminoglycoside O-phosphotransferase [Afifella sp. JA880]